MNEEIKVERKEGVQKKNVVRIKSLSYQNPNMNDKGGPSTSRVLSSKINYEMEMKSFENIIENLKSAYLWISKTSNTLDIDSDLYIQTLKNESKDCDSTFSGIKENSCNVAVGEYYSAATPPPKRNHHSSKNSTFRPNVEKDAEYYNIPSNHLNTEYDPFCQIEDYE